MALTNHAKLMTGALLGGLLFPVGLLMADVEISRGNRILIDKGLQIQAQVFDNAEGQFSRALWPDSHFTTMNFQWIPQPAILGASAPGQQWGRWVIDSSPVQLSEMNFLPGLASLQYGDEQDISDPAVLSDISTHLQSMRQSFPDTLSFANLQASVWDNAAIRNYMVAAQPDMLMFDRYVFRSSTTFPVVGGTPTGLYQTMQQYRLLGLGGIDGTGNRPIPVGQYAQTFELEGHTPTASEVRLYYFSSWTFGNKVISDFVYDNPPSTTGVQSALFNGAGDLSPTPLFYDVAETNRQSRNLGPTLVRLLTTDVRYVTGRHANGNIFDSDGTANSLPQGITRASSINGWGSSFITNVVAENIGNTNEQSYYRGNQKLAGDVVLGFFKLLDESSDGASWSDQAYFMILNGLTEGTGSPLADTHQRISINFDFGDSGITSLQRLNRDTGLVELVTLAYDGGSLYHFDLTLDGGVADLFKFNTGAPFVVPEPMSLPLLGLAGVALLRGRPRRRYRATA